MNPARRPLMAANWKMNNNWDDCEVFVEGLRTELPLLFGDEEYPVEVLVCPPAIYLALMGTMLEDSEVLLGNQDVSLYEGGAYTGDISAAMLADVGCDYGLAGHSERRNVFGDTDEIVAGKIARLRAEEIVPVVCIGEALEVRDAGEAVNFTLAQLAAVQSELKQCTPDGLVIAYEPVWAIGTGRNAEPADAQEMSAAIRNWLTEHLGSEFGAQVPVLYGGSVKPENVRSYLSQPDIDGALVGGASLKATSFCALIKECAELLVAD